LTENEDDMKLDPVLSVFLADIQVAIETALRDRV